MKFRKAVLSALIAAAASAAAADQASPRLIGRFFSEKSSREEHRLGIAAFADIDLSGAGYVADESRPSGVDRAEEED